MYGADKCRICSKIIIRIHSIELYNKIKKYNKQERVYDYGTLKNDFITLKSDSAQIKKIQKF
jgi:hypothetical protein